MFTALAQRLYYKKREDYAAKLQCEPGRMLRDTAQLLIGF